MKKIILSLFLAKNLFGMDDPGEELIKDAIKKIIIQNASICPFTPEYFETKVVDKVFQRFEKKEDGYYFPALCFKSKETLFQDQVLAIYDEVKKKIIKQ